MFDPESPMFKEALEKIKDEQFEPIKFKFELGREMLQSSGTDIANQVKDDADPRHLQCSGRGTELAQAILHTIEMQHKVHPITPAELAMGFQMGWSATLTAGNSMSATRLSIAAGESIIRIAKTLFSMAAFERIMEMTKKLKPKE